MPPRTLGDRLGLDARETDELICRLLADGLLEEKVDAGAAAYEVTDKGHAFCLASCLKKIPRAKIEALLGKAVAACEAVNADGTLPEYIKCLRVFGSYLGDGEMLGDLDLALETQRRRGKMSKGDYAEWLADFGYRHCPRGEWLDQILYPWTMLCRRLKNRSPYVSIHSDSELKRLGAKNRVVFRAKRVAPPRP